ncbi:MAG: hypothetical protein MUW56_21970 [Chryseobacterium sp.]|nr:hypothetical protein [Chryseobacterium sp.]MCJ7936222.1 hypothetical protein [Chryseobacterium sp.]
MTISEKMTNRDKTLKPLFIKKKKVMGSRTAPNEEGRFSMTGMIFRKPL